MMTKKTPKVDEMALLDKVKKGGVKAKVYDLEPHIRFKALSKEWHVGSVNDKRFVTGRPLVEIESYWETENVWARFFSTTKKTREVPFPCPYCKTQLVEVFLEIRTRVAGINEKVFERVRTETPVYGEYCPTCGYKKGWYEKEFPDWA
jgi:hypothetical protein